MTTRFDAIDAKNYGVPGVKSGYDGNVKSELSIPSCGVEDVDTSLFNLFDKEIQPMVGGIQGAELKKVPIIFAAGEKWALLKKGRPLRDKNNTLILPLITIARMSLNQGPEDYAGRGINQQTGEIVVRRRLDSSDRDYQNLINRNLLINQTNLAVTGSMKMVANQLLTDRHIGNLQNDSNVRSGALLAANRTNNIFETLVVPAPQFYTAQYEVTVWAQYMQHMNQIVEKLMSSFLPQAQSWKLITPKGYWFIASVDGGGFAVETNFDDMSSAERYIKCKIQLKVPAYVWASSAPGVPIPVKRYISSPIIDFNLAIDIGDAAPEEFSNNYTLGSDDPTLPLDEQPNLRTDQRRPGWRSQVIQPSNSQENVDANDPALKSYPRGINPGVYKKLDMGGNQVKYVKIIKTNAATGETVYSAADLEALKIIPVGSI